jgi:two-component system, sensor histidine kinase PdtaS
MKRTIALLILWLGACFSFAQNIQRLTISDYINRASDLSFNNKDSALYFANQALTTAQKLDSPRLIFLSYRVLGMVHEDNNQLLEAQAAYKLALELANLRLTDEERLTIYTDWAIIHKKLGQYAVAQQYHQMTIDEASKIDRWDMVEDGYHGLGTMYSMISDFNQSIQSYHKSIEAAQKCGNQEGIILSEQNISTIYMKAKNYNMALKNIEKTYQNALKLGDSMRIGAVLKIYGKINTAMGNYFAALDKTEKAKAIFQKTGNKTQLSDAYLALGDIYFNQKNYSKAESYFDTCTTLVDFLPQYSAAELFQKKGKLYQIQAKTEAAIEAFSTSLIMTDSLGFKEIAKENHNALASIYTENGKYELANIHILAANRLSESLFAEANQKNMTEAQFKFDLQKRDLEIEGQKKELKHSSNIRWLLVGGMGLLSILLFFTWKQMREKQKANIRNSLIIKELHHRVKNNMQTVASMMRLQARESSDPSVSAVLLENKLRLETFSMLHQQLYVNDNVETLNLRHFVDSMIGKLRFTHKDHANCLFDTDIRIDNTKLDVETALSVGLILNELMTNTLKHAKAHDSQSEHQNSLLNISIQLTENALHYADNGQGLPKDFDFEKNAGFGIQLVSYFSEQIKGKYKFSVNNGMRFDLSF